MPPPTASNPFDIPADLPKTTLILSHFANLKLSGDRLVHDTINTLTTLSPPTIPHVPRPRRRRARNRAARSTRVHKMSDADLEAELAARRAARQRERDRYARAIRSEKLSALESELNRLRSELSRMDRAGGLDRGGLGAGTPPTSRWEALPDRRSRASLGGSSTPPVPGAPPPPPPGPGGDEVVDPEKRRREKEERQRRREAKRREREANRKPLTLADIIKSAGPDPMARLKPPGSIPVPDVHAPQEVVGEDIQGVKEGLKKVSLDEDGHGESEKDDAEEEGKDDEKKEDKATDGVKDDSKATSDEAKEDAADAEGADGKAANDAEKSKDSSENAHEIVPEPKAAENQSPTKVTNTATSPQKSSPAQNTSRQEIQPDTGNAAKDAAPNGTANGAVDALAALSKLKAKLPKTGDGDQGKERKRVSVEEKRRLRRAAKEEEKDGK